MMDGEAATKVRTRSWFRAWLHEYVLHRKYLSIDADRADAMLNDGTIARVEPVPGTAGQWRVGGRIVDASEIYWIEDGPFAAGYNLR